MRVMRLFSAYAFLVVAVCLGLASTVGALLASGHADRGAIMEFVDPDGDGVATAEEILSITPEQRAKAQLAVQREANPSFFQRAAMLPAFLRAVLFQGGLWSVALWISLALSGVGMWGVDRARATN